MSIVLGGWGVLLAGVLVLLAVGFVVSGVVQRRRRPVARGRRIAHQAWELTRKDRAAALARVVASASRWVEGIEESRAGYRAAFYAGDVPVHILPVPVSTGEMFATPDGLFRVDRGRYLDSKNAGAWSANLQEGQGAECLIVSLGAPGAPIRERFLTLEEAGRLYVTLARIPGVIPGFSTASIPSLRNPS